MNRTGPLKARTLAVVLPVDMGNYGQNLLGVKETFGRLASAAPSAIQFVSYHRRRSGNFVFSAEDVHAIQSAPSICKEIVDLPCLVRTLEELKAVLIALPENAQINKRGSYFLMAADGPRKVIYVALSHDVPTAQQRIGDIRPW